MLNKNLGKPKGLVNQKRRYIKWLGKENSLVNQKVTETKKSKKLKEQKTKRVKKEKKKRIKTKEIKKEKKKKEKHKTKSSLIKLGWDPVEGKSCFTKVQNYLPK